MPRDSRATQNMKLAKTTRARALARPEMLLPSSPRKAAAGLTSMAVKIEDPATRRMIDEAVARRSVKP